jgi:hypothetical protein
MTWQGDPVLAEFRAWCATQLGPCSPDLDHTRLHPGQRAAGQALAALHTSAVGDFYGPCRRDGTPAGAPIRDVQDFLATDFERWLVRCNRLRARWRAVGRIAESRLDSQAT